MVNSFIILLTNVVNKFNKEGDFLIPKFMSLEAEKRERIINAALNEFAQRGYKNASTNEIVKKANISKGLLFHYFKNKKGLFLFLLNYAKDILVDEFYKRLNYNETDIIKRLRQIALLKIDLICKYPSLYDFMLSVAIDDSAEIKQYVDSISKSVIEDAYKRLFVNIDTSVFKDDLDKKSVLEIIVWVVQGFSNSELEKIRNDFAYKSSFDLNAIMKEFDKYMEILKSVFYK